mmetsp:Transcript_29776/g.81645  ORF Transcript_29776/g.81645 Transcript_29776/m.81645 type:complete len:340 (+) Transcript_29776:2264-3283(+)
MTGMDSQGKAPPKARTTSNGTPAASAMTGATARLEAARPRAARSAVVHTAQSGQVDSLLLSAAASQTSTPRATKTSKKPSRKRRASLWTNSEQTCLCKPESSAASEAIALSTFAKSMSAALSRGSTKARHNVHNAGTSQRPNNKPPRSSCATLESTCVSFAMPAGYRAANRRQRMATRRQRLGGAIGAQAQSEDTTAAAEAHSGEAPTSLTPPPFSACGAHDLAGRGDARLFCGPTCSSTKSMAPSLLAVHLVLPIGADGAVVARGRRANVAPLQTNCSTDSKTSSENTLRDHAKQAGACEVIDRNNAARKEPSTKSAAHVTGTTPDAPSGAGDNASNS